MGRPVGGLEAGSGNGANARRGNHPRRVGALPAGLEPHRRWLGGARNRPGGGPRRREQNPSVHHSDVQDYVEER